MPIPKGNKKTDAQRKAQNKWQAANESTLGCKLKKPVADQFRLYAQQNGTTVSALLSKFVKETLETAGMLPNPKAPADPVQDDDTGEQ